MPAKRTCPRCGAELAASSPRGFCARCLLLDALEAEPGADVSETLRVPETAPGTHIRYFGDYELLEELGRGGMGVVYQARQTSLNRLVALKLVPGGEFANPQFVERFRTEAEAAARLQHPHIVAIHEVGEHEGQHYFSMDYVEGPTLEEQARKGPLAPKHAANLVATLAAAIQYAHDRGIVHRDLKPSNVLIDPFGQPRITDFGLAKVLTGDSDLTLTGQPLGSPGYMAPEQAEGQAGTVGPPSDVYGLGALLYHLLTGRAPFQAETLTEVLRQVREAEVVSPRLLNPSVPRDLETICLKCLEKEPARRYQTAAALAEELERYVGDRSIVARPVGRPEKLWRWCRRQPVLAGLTAALATVFVLGFAGVTWQWREAETARLEAEEGRQWSERLRYAADMKAAFHAVAEGSLREARRYLTNYWPRPDQPDLRSWEWRYLWRQCRGDEFTLVGRHAVGAGAVAFSPDNRMLASGGKDGWVRVWDLDSQTQIHGLKLGEAVPALAFSPDGSQLAVGADATLLLWNARTWHTNDILVITNGVRVESVHFSNDGSRLYAVNWTELGIWQLAGGVREVRPLPYVFGMSPGQHAMDLSADGRYAAFRTLSTSPRRSQLMIQDLRTGAQHCLWEGGPDQVRTLAFSPDGSRLVVAYSLEPVSVYDFPACLESTHRPVEARKLAAKGTYIDSLAFSADGRLLAMGDDRGNIEVWEVPAWRRVRELRGHERWILDLAFSSDTNDTFLASASGDGTVRLWRGVDAPQEELVPWSTDDLPLFAGPKLEHTVHVDSTSKTCRIADNLKGSLGPVLDLPFPADNITNVNVSADGLLLAFALRDRTVAVWDCRGKTNRWHTQTQDQVLIPHFSPDGTLLFGMKPYGGRMWIWDAENGRQIGCADNPWAEFLFYFPQFTRDRRQLAIPYGVESTVCLWDFAGTGERKPFEGRHPECFNLAISPDNRTLATISWQGTIQLWDVPTRRATKRMGGSAAALMGVTFSPDNKRVLVSSGYEIQVWDVETGREVANFPGDALCAMHLRFKDDDTLLATSVFGLARMQAPSFDEIDAFEGRK
ncbi:MAG: protein kinase [Verrucomicrobiales bacterium]|nr:protein kinase [Verrucomicrobiales bacterium]